MIGEQIKKYRIQKGLTQEELGNMVGVTTQAVSKWERGGSPDAEILPVLARSLGVTIDMFYESNNVKSIEDTLTDEILSMNHEDGFRKLFSLMWRISLGLSGLDPAKKGFADNGYAIDELKEKSGYHYYARASLDGGMIDAKMDPDFTYLFFMPEPKDGYAKNFENIEELRNIFSILAEPDVLKILFFMYTRINLPISLSLIASSTNIKKERAEKLMEKLCSVNLAVCTPVATENGNMKIYTYYNETVMVPILCSAKELLDKNIIHWGVWFDRNIPLF